MMVLGDRASFYSCSFVGVQDTLCDLQGRHYFKDCMIQGAVDFVYGYGQTIYEDCYLVTVPGLPVPGWVTANGRSGPDQPGGFVFKNCWLYGGSKVYLGRAWGSYSRVIFYNTNMSDIVVPQGWDSWLTPDKGANTTYGEAGCTGPGSNGQFRVPWEKKLSPDAVQQFTDITYVDPEGWLAKQAWA
ncbi:putative pectinesterase 29 [Apostasia shenzhenica]|uniref:pectinesterase n=1 Tax=Apostasia shenzhenica TaxID=1088818 RepID=A0A2I0AGJ6_9ASPA|nr:putative pectinesterase 29 [Apostasia shenzhenica]